jgi:hypothetical protein
LERNIEEIGFRYGGPGASPSGDQPPNLRTCRLIAAALAESGSMAAAIAVMLVITVWGYMSWPP